MKDILAVVFHPPSGGSSAERLVHDGRWAASQDLIAVLRNVGLEPVLAVTSLDEESTRTSAPDTEVFEIPKRSPFHFGETLKDLIRERDPAGLLYFGSGSGLLLTRNRMEYLRRFAERDLPGAVFNNFYSCDFAAVSAAGQLLALDLPEIDNPLGFVLADAGIPCSTLERSAQTLFDIDTPTDVLILGVADRGGPAIRTFLGRLDLTHPDLPTLLNLLSDRSAHVCLVGRANPKTWTDIEGEIACRTSGLLEGRGMRAGTNTHLPVLHQMLQEEGIPTFFDRLSRACDGAVIDTRPLLCGTGPLAPPADRFASDLLRPQDIRNPLWKSFTEAALAAPIPILLGGHSAVSGGLYLLAEACWKGRTMDRRLHPKPFNLHKEPS
jgi:hypothetical protein